MSFRKGGRRISDYSSEGNVTMEIMSDATRKSSNAAASDLERGKQQTVLEPPEEPALRTF